MNEEAKELAEAKAAAGKAMLYNHAIFESPLPADFSSRYPDLAPLAAKIAGDSAAATNRTASFSASPMAISDCDNPATNDCAWLMSDSKMQKQKYGYYCGPTSLQAITWNDPKSPNYQTQEVWASILHTDQNGSTYIGDLKNAINTYTHWDDSDYAGAYIVVGISTWTDTSYRNLFRTHTRTSRAPIQLHPRLIWPSTTSYYQGTTDGHFDVGRGYDFTAGDYIYLFEPAGKDGQYVPVSANETTPYITKAQYANTNQRNISY